MKKFFFILLMGLVGLSVNSHAAPLSGKAFVRCAAPDPLAAVGTLVISTTSAPTATVSILLCMGNNAEINGHMLQKEATLLNEENKIYVPSFLGAYAEKRGLSLGDAANEVLAVEQ